jgi:hypothetical protein
MLESVAGQCPHKNVKVAGSFEFGAEVWAIVESSEAPNKRWAYNSERKYWASLPMLIIPRAVEYPPIAVALHV